MVSPGLLGASPFAATRSGLKSIPPQKAMASSYIDTLRGEFDPDQYHDEYRQALEKVVMAKAEGVPLPESEEEEPEGAEVVDLVAALRASVEAAKARRAGGGSGEAEPAKKVPAKKAAAKKAAPAKKTAAKKAAAKTTAKKAAKKTTKKSA